MDIAQGSLGTKLQGIAVALVVCCSPLAACKKSPEPMTRYDLSLESNQKFLQDNGARDDVTTLPDGLQYRVIKAGDGRSPKSDDDLVTVAYQGTLIDGTVFDSTPPGQTAQFNVGGLIPGWTEILKLMKEGDEWEVVIPAPLAYGVEGSPPAIAPNQTLVFDLNLLSVAQGP